MNLQGVISPLIQRRLQQSVTQQGGRGPDVTIQNRVPVRPIPPLLPPPPEHPQDAPYGFMENLIRSLGREWGTMVQEDDPYLEQYFHADRNILPRTNLRPTGMRPRPDLVFREPAFRERLQLQQELDNPTIHEGGGFNDVTSFGGLGMATLSGEDEPGNRWRSIYDIWDFDTKTPVVPGYGKWDPSFPLPLGSSLLDSVAKMILRRMGTPYAVYGREPYVPEPPR